VGPAIRMELRDQEGQGQAEWGSAGEYLMVNCLCNAIIIY